MPNHAAGPDSAVGDLAAATLTAMMGAQVTELGVMHTSGTKTAGPVPTGSDDVRCTLVRETAGLPAPDTDARSVRVSIVERFNARVCELCGSGRLPGGDPSRPQAGGR